MSLHKTMAPVLNVTATMTRDISEYVLSCMNKNSDRSSDRHDREILHELDLWKWSHGEGTALGFVIKRISNAFENINLKASKGFKSAVEDSVKDVFKILNITFWTLVFITVVTESIYYNNNKYVVYYWYVIIYWVYVFIICGGLL